MRILLTQSTVYIPSIGGANKSNRLLLEAMSARGHTCSVVAPAGDPRDTDARGALLHELHARDIKPTGEETASVIFDFTGVRVHAVIDRFNLRAEFLARLADFRPDCVLVSSEDPGQALLEAAVGVCPEKVVYLAHTTLALPFGPAAAISNRSKTELLRNVRVVTDSGYIQTYCRQWAGLQADLLRFYLYGSDSFPDFGSSHEGLITMVNPCAFKGSSIFLALARAFPSVQFGAVPSWGTCAKDLNELSRYDNVKILPPSNDVHDILRLSRVILVPSLWAEAKGRIVIEAMLCGIPVMASDIGGLVEAKLGVDYLLPVTPIEHYGDELDERMLPRTKTPPQKIEPWKKALHELVSNEEQYRRVARASRIAAHDYLQTIDVAAIEQYLAPTLRPALESSRLEVMRAPDRMSRAKRSLVAAQLLRERMQKGSKERNGSFQHTDDGAIHRHGLRKAPLSFAQERLWLSHALDPASSNYHEVFALQCAGPLVSAAFGLALLEIVRRHESLRTSFTNADGEPRQIVDSASTEMPLVCDLEALAEAEREFVWQKWARDEFRKPFDLEHGPLFRWVLWRSATNNHVLVFAIHHIACDGWSTSVFVNELGILYRRLTGQQADPLPPLNIQYSDFAIWERSQSAAKDIEREVGSLCEQLASLSGVNLPGAREIAGRPEAHSTVFDVRIDSKQAGKWRELARSHRTTLSTTLLAAFNVLLSKLSNQSKFALTVITAGRERAEVQGLIGFFVNNLVVIADLTGNPDFSTLIVRLHKSVLNAYSRQAIPFQGLGRQAHKAISQIGWIYQNIPSVNAAIPSIEITINRAPGCEKVEFDAQVQTFDTGDGLLFRIGFRDDIFDVQAFEHLARSWKVLLESLPGCPHANLADILVLDARQLDQILLEWNATSREVSGTTVMDQIVRQAEERLDAVAVVYEQESVSYGELDWRTNQLGWYLRERGVGPEVCVGVCLERSVELVVALLGILKAGGAYVPLDPDYPAERLDWMMEDCDPAVVITMPGLADSTETDARKRLYLDKAGVQIAVNPTTAPDHGLQPNNLIYTIYTSGSTGRPKGAMNTQAGVSNRLEWMQRTYGFHPGDRVLQKTPMSFDVSVWELFCPLMTGGCLVLARPGGQRDASYLVETIIGEQITIVHFVPSLLELWLRESRVETCESLRLIVSSGEALKPELIHATRARLNAELENLYGPTEAAVDVTRWRCGSGSEEGNVPIGRPIANTRVYVVDAYGGLVPIGGLGELCIAGIGLARGYLNRPDLTAERFVPNPYGGAGERMYRTGDHCRWRADGNLEFVGRVDDQVKVRGYRIELGEIESALRSHAGVREAVVVAREEEGYGKRLVGYVVGAGEGELEAQELRRYVRGKLPEYMVPSTVMVLERLPLTSNGKLDRKGLPKPEWRSGEANYEEPRGPLEEIVANVWKEVLGRERVGREENFFELGGHSLLATQVVSRIRQSLDVELALRVVFELPTVAGMSAEVERARVEGRRGVVPVLSKVERSGDLPLSYAQQRLWFLDQLEPDSAVYNVPHAMRLEGRLDVAALEWSLSEMVRRHEVLRTSFPSVSGTGVQRVSGSWEVQLSVVDVSGDESVARSVVKQEVVKGFDLSGGPVLRAKLVRLGEEEHVLVVVLHHIISDGWSVGIMMRELTALYESRSSGSSSGLEELQVQYGDYAVWQREWLSGEVMDEQVSYWKGQLSELETLELPTDYRRPAVLKREGGKVGIELGEELTRKLEELSRREGVTLFMTLLAGFQVVLGRWSGQRDVAVGTPIAGRRHVETEGLIGFFVNTLVLRTRWEPDTSFVELLQQVRGTVLEAYEHQDVPFEKLVEELEPERTLNRSPLFQVAFVLQNAPGATLRLGEAKLQPFGVDTKTAKFDVALDLSAGAHGVGGVMEYSAELYGPETVARLARHFRQLLETVAGDADLSVAQISLLSAAEREQLVEEWNGGRCDYLPEERIHRAFEAQADSTPQSIAMIYGDAHLSYGELERRSNQVAHHLTVSGVKAEDRVVVELERGFDCVAAMLGVLKAGAAYVPIDPEYPSAARQHMKDDAQAAMVISRDELERATLGDPCRLAVPVDPDNLAYVMYTSGSTGLPKGVMATHRASLNRFAWAWTNYPFQSGEICCQKTSISFVDSVWEIFGALLRGIPSVIVSDEGVKDLPRFVETLRLMQVSRIVVVPSLLRAILATGIGDGLPAMRMWTSSGETLPRDVAAALHGSAPSSVLLNLYGSSETAADSTVCQIMERREGGATVPIGRPISNTNLRVLDPWGELVAPGVAGQVFIGGAGLARGYWNRPEWTAERFVPDPFSRDPGCRLYRTGDLARWLWDGNLEYLGRSDQQVKLRGQRIELSHIEIVAKAHPAVREAVVILREDEEGDQRLAAYVVPREQGAAQIGSELAAYLRGKLPEYMVPSTVMVLERLPLTSNGKLDRKGLPKPEWRSGEANYEEPRGPLEEIVANVWKEVLGRERVGREENFFELGGHSLLATQVVSRIRQSLDVELALRVVFELPTVAGMSAEVERARVEGRRGVVPVLSKVERSGDLPLSYAQQRLWFLDQLEPDSAVYNVPHAMRLEGRLDVAALEWSLSEMVRRHEVLRTSFPSVSGTGVQRVSGSWEVQLSVVDVSGDELAARSVVKQEVVKGFDLSGGPVWRAKLVRLGEEEHVLVVVLHHIISDGWSVGIMVRELTALYESRSSGSSSGLEELQVQYGDYAVWQREWLSGEVMDEQVSYWKGQLSELETLELPTDYRRPAVLKREGGKVGIELGEELTRKLEELSRREGVTLFMTLLAGFQVVLGRWSGQRDVAVGTPIAGRRHVETEGLIGFFVNTLVLRTRWEPDTSFVELLQQVRGTVLEAYEHQDVPFEKLVEELEPERTLNRSPLFQVAFVLQNAPGATLRLGEAKLQPFGVDTKTAKFDVALDLSAGAHGVGGVMEYSAELYGPETVARLARHFRQLLETVAGDADLSVAQISLLSAAEREQLVEEWNRTAAAVIAERIDEAFLLQVTATGDSIALAFEDNQMSYGELEKQSGELAKRLRGLGVRAEDRVIVCLERSCGLVVALLGVLRAGAAYVPLNPDYPMYRMLLIEDRAQARVVVTVSSLTGRLPKFSALVVCMDEHQANVLPDREAAGLGSMDGASLAYVMYTSGSMGEPKGVEVEHRSIMRLVKGRRGYALSRVAVLMLLSPVTFDASTFEIWGALANGGRLEIYTPGVPTLEELGRYIEARGVTVLWLTSGLFHQMVDSELGRLKAVQQLLAGGDVLSLPHTMKAAQELAGTKVINGYGPTENTTFTTCHRIEPVSALMSSVPIGKPIANTTVYVLDESQEPVPVGVVGELYTGGAGLARGYSNRGDLTAERFVPNPYGGAGERMYRTGDRCRWRADGNLEFVGRVDDQVKVRGYRIELGEIESALRSHAGVREAVVVAREEEGYGKRLVGYVVGAGEGELEAQELRRYVRGKLPEYMVPSTVMVLERLPLTSNGKLDRKGLPKPEWRSGEANYEEPRGPLEEIVANVWKEVLGRERVGREENFFELGGHSLLATQVVSRIRQSLDVELALRVVFELPTVAGMSAEVERARVEGRRGVVPVLSKVERSGDLPLSYAQQRLWFLDQLEPDSAVYNVPHAMRLEGRLDVAALEWSLSEMVRRHEVLRTSFPSVSGTGVQRVSGSWEVQLSVVDVSGDELAARSVVKQEVVKGFDLSGGPVWRAKLVRLGEEEHVLVVVLHHIISDGWSVGIMVRELTALYESRSSGSSSGLEELQVQYGDYAVWQREWLSGEVMDEQVSYWKGQLSELETLELPTDYRRPAVLKREGGKVGIELGEELTRKLEELSRREGVTLFMTLLAGFQVVLGRWSGQRDVAVGTPIAGRRHVETEGLIGFFVNTLVLRTRWEPDTSFVELLQQVRGTVLEAYEHQDVPFEKLVEELEPERTLNRSPLFQVAFVLQNAPGATLRLGEAKLRPFGVDTKTAKFDVALDLSAGAHGVGGVMEYSAELYGPETVRRVGARLQQFFEGVVQEGDWRVGDIQLLTEEEREELLRAGSGAVCGERRETVGERISEQARQRPDAVAVVYEQESVSYGELEQRSNQLGHFLRRRGVGPEVRVGVCLERSPEVMIALLGILKAGGAYVPLDPDYPAERLGWMMEDCDPAVVITRLGLAYSTETDARKRLYLDKANAQIAVNPTTAPDHGLQPNNLIYTIYTSGSTGRPKGAMNTQAGVSNRLEWMQRTYGFHSGDRVLQKTPMSFDVSVWELFCPLMTGGCLVLARPGGQRDVSYLVETIIGEQITIVHFVPSLLELWLRESRVETCESLRLIVSSGEALKPELIHATRARLNVELENLYGPTEVAVDVTCWSCGSGSEEVSVPIGRPIANTQVYVVDEGMELVPVGGLGELCIGGAGVARGYVNRGDLTAEKFVPNPYGGGGERMYRTGDRCRWRADGNLEFVGRVDDQVKVRGYRIELGEIESALRSHAGVREAVVVAREEEGYGKRLVGYVVGAGEGELEAQELRRYVRGKLPEYMVPSTVMVLERLPLTAHGKVDRRKLPEPERIETGEGRVGPRNEREAGLARIWEQVLGVEGVGINDNFFELGGDSILSIQIVARARQAGMRITVRDMFQHQTIGGLVEAGLRGERVDAEQGEVRGRVQLTPIQAWYFGRERKEVGHYNQAVLLEGAEGWRGERVERVWEALARQHDALRMKFSYRDGEWEQSNEEWERGETGFAWIDLREIEECDKRRGVEGVNEQLQGSLDLEEGQVARLGYMGLSGGEVRMLVAIHHLVVDGVSWRILLEDLQKGYAQIAGGSEVELGDKTSSYQQWAEALRRWAESAEVKREAEYWEGVEGAGRGQVWRDWEEGANTVDSSESYMVELGEGETEALLRERGKREGAGAQEVLLAAVVEALGENSGTWKWRIDVEGHGRESEVEGVDVTRTVGWFTTIYPVCLGGEGGVGPDERLREIREQMKAVPRRGLGYGLLRYGSSVRLVKQESTEISFNYLGQFDQVLEAAGKLRVGREAMGPVRHRGGTREYVLELVGAVRGGRLQMQFGYSRNVHRRETIEKLAQSFLHAVQQLVRDQETVYSLDGEVIPEREWSHALAEMSSGDQSFDERHIEAVYELTPLQEGILFESMYAPEAALYTVQSCFLLENGVDAAVLRQAWQAVVERHAVLRTAFAWKQVSRPVQIVMRAVELPLVEEDWRDVGSEEQKRRLSEYVQRDGERGFDLSQPPLIRLALMRVGEDAYELICTYHHILLDGWSHYLFLKEVVTHYEALREGQQLRLPLSRPYRDYVKWLRGRDESAAEAFWRKYLTGLERGTGLELSTGKGEPEARGKGEEEIELSAETTQELQRLARQSQVTLNTVVQGAWALTLSLHSGERDVVFGSTVSGRPAELDCEATVGLFINTIPVRVAVRPEMGVDEWLRRLQRQQGDAFAYQYTPLTRIRQWSELGDGDALIESILVYENYPLNAFETSYGMEAIKGGGLRVKLGPTYDRASPTVSLNVWMVGERMKIRISYERQWWGREQMWQVVMRTGNVLRAMAADERRAVGTVDLLSAEERAWVLGQSRGRWRESSKEQVQDRVAKQAVASPESIALSDGEQWVSYAELDRRANQLSRYLRESGVGAEVRVGVCLRPTVELMRVVLGVLKAGGAYVPLDPEYPASRLDYMAEDAQLGVLITEKDLAKRMSAGWMKTIVMDEEEEDEIGRQSDAESNAETEGSNLAYVLYTSGSTGQPKGVMISHEGLSHYLRWCEEEYGMASGWGAPLNSSISFDLSVTAMFGPLVSGRCVRLVGGNVRGVEGLLNLCGEEAGYSFVKVTPSHLKVLREQLGADGVRKLAQRLIVGGETLSWKETGWWGEQAPEVVIVNEYGPTETVVGCVVYEVRQQRGEGDVPIGKPITNTTVYVLDENQESVPVGVAGELYIGGAGVARGYVNRGDLTAERFVPNPYGGAGERMYRTGDRCRWRADGNLEFVGRVDDQVKVRGYRIELGEIESALRSHAGVRDAVVVAREEEGYGKRLVGYVVGEGEGRLDGQEVRRYVRGKLPEYMTPSTIMVLERLPLTSNGKLDRKGLPKPEWRSGEANYEEPRGPLEEIVANVWKEVLGRERVGREENFFELGGHSLLATQVVSRIRQSLDVELALRVVFELPTVAGMSAEVERARGEGRRGVVPVLSKVERSGDLPLSYAQQRLWFLDQLEPDSAVYNVPHAMRLEGRLDVAALEWSLSEMVRRHEVLRTSFPSVSGTGVQRVSGSWEVQLSVVDVSGDELAARSVVKQEVVKGFDLSGGPVWRAKLVRLGEEEHVLVVVLHHIISDGWSVGIMVRELTALYESRSSGSSSGLEELQVQYGDYAVWQREWLSGEVMDEQVSYWKGQLSELETLELPTDYRRPAVLKREGGKVGIELGEELTRKLEELSRREGVTLFMTLLAGFQVVLGRWSGQRDVTVGTDIANRRHVETEGLIGFFVNQLVLRTRWEPDTSFVELLKQVRRTVLEAYEHQDVPFEKLVEELEPERALNRSPLFQVKLVLQNVPRQELRLGDMRVRGMSSGAMVARCDLLWMVSRDRAGLSGMFEYDTELYKAETVRRVGARLQQFFEGVVQEGDWRVGDIQLLTEEEREELLRAGSGAVCGERRETVGERISEQARQRPDAVAVVYEQESVSYGELEQRSNQLGHFLRRRGVGPEVRVGVCLERSPEVMIALLGILKAGGAYVPLDPDYPAERLGWMMEDSQTAIVLSQERIESRLPVSWAQFIWVEQWNPDLKQEKSTALEPAARPENAAYVIFTSGSTGRPKGVVIEHCALNNYLRWCESAYPLPAGVGSVAHTPVSFDLTITSLFPMLESGQRVRLLKQESSVGELREALREAVHEGGFSVVKATPAHLQILSEDGIGDIEGGTASWVVGGEALASSTLRPWRQSGWDVRIFNEYGPTEATVGCTVYEVEKGWDGDWAPIGKPIANTQVYVVDEGMELVPVGGLGELCIGGAGLARGYVNRGDLTAERFVPNPYGGAGERMYRTGDRCRWQADGNLEFVGRVDDQVKVRGYRIELGEIESALRSHAGVREAVVVAREEEGYGKRLVGYVVGEEEGELDGQEVRRYVRGKLPEYMVPSTVMVLERMPLTSNGKLDRKGLPKPEWASGEASYEEPRTQTEKVLAEIWAEVLGRERVGREENFFELGGDSILSIQIVSRANEAGLRLTPRQVFEYQTVAALASVAGVETPSNIDQGAISGAVPLTPIQEWFFETVRADRHHFNQSVFLELGAKYPEHKLNAVVRRLLAHHDVLRLRFALLEGKPSQFLTEFEDVDRVFSKIHLSDVDPKELSRHIEQEAEKAQRSLDLENGPIARFVWFSCRTGTPDRLLCIIHHLAVDAVSWRILLSHFERLLQAPAADLATTLPPKTTSFKTWAQRLQSYANDQRLDAERAYWANMVRNDGASDHEDHSERISEPVTIGLESAETDALLGEIPRMYHAKINEVLLAALAQAITESSGNQEVWIDLEGHGREDLFEDIDLTRTVGWFTTLSPVHLICEKNADPTDLLTSIKTQLRSGPVNNSTYGVLRYLRRDNLVRDLKRPDICFNYLGQFDQILNAGAVLRLAHECTGAAESSANPFPHCLEVVASVVSGQLRFHLNFNRPRYDFQKVTLIANRIVSTIRILLSSCCARDSGTYMLSDFPLAGLDQATLDRLARQTRKLTVK